MIDEEEINNINKRLEELEKKYDLIKKENIEYKNALKKNEQTIINLMKQIKIIRIENQNYLNKEIQKLKKLIENKENIKKENNEIIINDTNNDFIIFEKKDINFFNSLENNNINKKNQKKEKNNIIEFKENTLYDLLENKLSKIFSEQSINFELDDLNDLKKICSSILIMNDKDPNEKISEFMMKNLNNDKHDQLDEKIKANIAIKKTIIFESVQNIVLLKKIEAKDNDHYMQLFREKFGITEKDYSDKNLKKQIKKGKNEIDILKKILKELKYIN